MFAHSLDGNKQTTTPDGDTIIDLTKGSFNSASTPVTNYSVRKVPKTYIMRPDLISAVEYGSDDYTDYIMMYNECSNPFAIDEDDVLMIPDRTQADEMTSQSADSVDDDQAQEILVHNYYEYSDPTNAVDMDSYTNYQNKVINSPNKTVDASQAAPFILPDGETAATIKNGRIYFNDTVDSSSNAITQGEITSQNIDEKLQKLMSGLDTSLSDTNCTYNGVSLSDFIKASNNTKNSSSNS